MSLYQSGISRETEPIGDISIDQSVDKYEGREKERDYKRLAHSTVKAEKSPDLQLASWILNGKVGDLIPV